MSRLDFGREFAQATTAEYWSPHDSFDNVSLYFRNWWKRLGDSAIPEPSSSGDVTKPLGNGNFIGCGAAPLGTPEPIVPRSVTLGDGANMECELFRQLGGRRPWKESQFFNLPRIRNALRRKYPIEELPS